MISILFLLAGLLGAPLFVVIAAGALAGYHSQDVDLSVIAIEVYRIAEMPILLAIPLFTFAGYLLSETEAPKRLVSFVRAVFGGLPGGLPVIALCASAIFTAFTGASGVTIVALGAVVYPAMLHAGYNERFSLGLVTTSGSLGLLFAPSLPLILYGIVVQQSASGISVSIDDLFIAGVIPGVLMLVLLSIYCFFVGGKGERAEQREMVPMGKALKDVAWELPLPIVVLGGIYGGFFVVSEAATITVVYLLIVEVFIKREIPFRNLPRIVNDSMLIVGGIMIVLAVSLASTSYMIDAEFPQRLFEFVSTVIEDRFSFLLVLNIFLLILGAFLDIFAALVLVVPLILPIALQYGVDPIHLGIIFLANLQLGYMTPPVGLNLFLASYRFDKPIGEVYKASLPFLLVLLVAVLVITYIPFLTLGLL